MLQTPSYDKKTQMSDKIEVHECDDPTDLLAWRKHQVRFDDQVQEIQSCCTFDSQTSVNGHIFSQNFKIDKRSILESDLSDKLGSDTDTKTQQVKFTRANLIAVRTDQHFKSSHGYDTRLKRRKLEEDGNQQEKLFEIKPTWNLAVKTRRQRDKDEKFFELLEPKSVSPLKDVSENEKSLEVQNPKE